MKKFLAIASITIILGCNSATPENYFDIAVLNTNMIVGFGGEGFARELESPSAKMIEGTDKLGQMTREEVVNDKIKFAETTLAKVRDLKQTPETEKMLQASIALYEYILPVCRNEYLALAKQYDKTGEDEKIKAAFDKIKNNHLNRFQDLLQKLTEEGKIYAAKNKIPVNWGR